jgi:hypothetical protein
MALTLFIGGMFLGFFVGFLTMAVLAVRGRRGGSQETDAVENFDTCDCSSIVNSSPS